MVDELVSQWALELGEPYLPGGHCAWVAARSCETTSALLLERCVPGAQLKRSLGKG
jgi:hypothetical protein